MEWAVGKLKNVTGHCLPTPVHFPLMKGIIGIDEVGRGPLAGPITVCACYIEDDKKIIKDIFHNTIRDSKRLTKALRSNIYRTIRYKRYLRTRIEYVVASKSAAYIDKHGISKATKECLLSCIAGLKKKGLQVETISIRLDAGLVIPMTVLDQSSHIKGDERFVEIALASIMAKVTRDKYMERLSNLHSQYAWEKNVGYGTKEHRKAIETVGITKYHRKSYLKAFKLFDKAE